MDGLIVLADTANAAGASAGSAFGGLLGYLIGAFLLGKVFEKAGEPLWHGFVPILNIVTLVRVVGYSGWYALLYFIPFVGAIFHIFVALRLGKAFGKSTAFSIFLLWLFSPIGLAIIGFGQAQYNKAAATA